MRRYLTSSVYGFASILAQAAVVSAAFGRWLGFVLMMTALLGVLALGTLAILSVFRAATQFGF
jgi:hypothetical protein